MDIFLIYNMYVFVYFIFKVVFLFNGEILKFFLLKLEKKCFILNIRRII